MTCPSATEGAVAGADGTPVVVVAAAAVVVGMPTVAGTPPNNTTIVRARGVCIHRIRYNIRYLLHFLVQHELLLLSHVLLLLLLKGHLTRGGEGGGH